jgi:hypothetical protein
VIGGVAGDWGNPANYLASIERAPIQADGTLGAFATLSTSMQVGIRSFRVLVTRDNFFVVCGYNSGIPLVERAPITGSTLGAFSAVTTISQGNAFALASLLVGSKLYGLGAGREMADPHAAFGCAAPIQRRSARTELLEMRGDSHPLFRSGLDWICSPVRCSRNSPVRSPSWTQHL